jgi:hypothetical protein
MSLTSDEPFLLPDFCMRDDPAPTVVSGTILSECCDPSVEGRAQPPLLACAFCPLLLVPISQNYTENQQGKPQENDITTSKPLQLQKICCSVAMTANVC